MKLALGTVQFGTSYGAFGPAGKVDEDKAAVCLDRAAAAGVDTLDTAAAYGDSEEVLGRLGAAARFRIVTKVPPLKRVDDIPASINASLTALRTEQVHGFMLHHASDLLGPDGDAVWASLEAVRSQGLAAKIGVSVYTAEEAITLSDRYPFTLVQAPYSVFDQRMRTAGALQRLQDAGVELHVRSVFLQGFALADPATLPPYLAAHRDTLVRFRTAAAAHGLSPLALALAAVWHQQAIDRVVIGVKSPAELETILATVTNRLPELEVESLASENAALLNPAAWQCAA